MEEDNLLAMLMLGQYRRQLLSEADACVDSGGCMPAAVKVHR